MANKSMNARINVEFNEASSMEELRSGESVNTLFGKIKKWLNKLKSNVEEAAYLGDNEGSETIPEDVILTRGDIVNNLESESTNRPLSANQGKVLNERMSNAMSAVTTDTEVTDIRVGADGKTYPTAGDAVRGQVSQLSESIANIANRNTPKNIYSSTEYVDGKGFATWNNTLQNLSGYGYAELDVVGGTTIAVYGLGEKLSSYGYGIKDATGNIIQKGGESNGLIISIPNFAKKIVFTIPSRDSETLSLIMSFPITKEMDVLSNVVYKQNLIPNNSYTDDSVLFDVIQGKMVQHPYSATWETLFIDISKIKGGTLLLSNYPEQTSTYGYGFLDNDWNVFSYDAFEAGNNYLVKPNGATLLAISIRKAVADTIKLHYILDGANNGDKTDVIIIGDSWSDTHADHTNYTKWPVYFGKWINCNLHNYAMNGSRVYGEDDFNMNGTHGGQVAEAILDTSFSHGNVSLIIIEGSINDYNHGNTAEQVISGFTSHINRLHAEFPNAKMICILNHQISITKKLFDYMHTIKNGVKANTACPVYTSFGWLTPNNYIADRVHPNDNGYIQFAVNVIASAFGGDITFYNNTETATTTSSSGATVAVTIEEIYSNERIDRNIKLNVNGASSKGTGTVEFDGNSLICCMGFDSFPQLIVESLDVSNCRTSIVRCTTNPNVAQQRTIPISIGHAELNGTYIGSQVPTVYLN